MKNGIFITFEGGEGSGKSTQLLALQNYLETQGHNVLATREPGGTTSGIAIRKILLSAESKISSKTELLLYAADRAQHLDEVIRPALHDGMIVLCDRYIDSTRVYQGEARGLQAPWIELLEEICTEGLKPDLTLLLDVPAELGLKRSKRRLTEQNSVESRFENETLAFHQKVREGFLKLAAQESRFQIIDASQEISSIAEQIEEKVDHLILQNA